MRSLIGISGFTALLAAVVLIGASPAAWAGDGPWALEVRAVQINPFGDEGSLDVAELGNAGEHVIDFQDAVVPEVALARRVSDRFGLELSVLFANLDTELDISGAGTFELGDTDMSMYQLVALYDLAEWDAGRVRAGLALGYASFDDIDITDAANAEGVRSASLDGDLLYGINLRLDTDLGTRGWYLSSNLRWYLSGGPDMEIFGGSGSAGTLLGSGEVEFEPLVLSLGFGYRY